MPTIEQWLDLFRSDNADTRLRAACVLLRRSAEAPLPVLLEILDTLSRQGLGAAAVRALRSRTDPALAGEMLARMESTDEFIREAACMVLGGLGDRRATPRLVRRLDDPHPRVRRAAAFALGTLGDRAAVPALEQKRDQWRGESYELNRMLNWALEALSSGKDANGI